MDARWISFPRVGSALRGWLWIDKSIARLQARLVSEHAVLQADAIERDMVPLNYALRSTSFVPLGPRPAVEVSAFLVSPPPPSNLGRRFSYSAAFTRLTSATVTVSHTLKVSRQKLDLVNASWVTL